ncbi:MAG TPA: protein translocase subunit SecD [Cyanobacteria bacterium UBA11149]|nr:protein translocase subunit SecD [Cyanobacteria bacterium UBA11367]HBE57965.1 protein translocase subunit SecD [Cyanobacteria bacterium UBA11366]HBR76040.1 protein translocase subunit SecD [Cyanobacteria bacterium UBA11159]HBS71050.1 protein translocase subunit SecD [Cyanobacteria bacterium UBA11153]HBW90894.1 protein translocase subunit SecD [Cyanobacteria bacterium UBA11149]HCA95801.1 protein translocase subunit SecD [Cyanobacteria bacterium UBA9226]
MEKQRGILALIVVVLMIAIVFLVTMPIRLGLDLQGGAQLTIQLKTTEEIKKITAKELEEVFSVIEDRVNGLGVSEPVVQTVGSDQILVQLPGVNDPKEAERVLGGTAQLEFRKQKPGSEAQLRIEQEVRGELLRKKEELQENQEELEKNNDENGLATIREEIAENQAAIARSNEAIAKLFEDANLTGKNLKDANYGPAGQTSNTWEVILRFDAAGGQAFADLTKDLAGTGRSIGIFIDNGLISSPVVGPEFAQNGITGGNAVITGNFDAQSSKELAVQLRGGALPVPVEIVENRTVGATLGKDSIQRSIYAGIGGLTLVLVFMAVYYRVPGLIADVALIIYAILSLAAFAALGVTLTLPGIAGFILSIGMAVDANVLIFERTREEIRAGKTLYRSVESGFYRAFSSILDGNVTTVIACAALFWLGSGLVKGFALTLGLGVMVSMFTAITCSRTFMLLLVLGIPGLRQKPQLFVPNPPVSQ